MDALEATIAAVQRLNAGEVYYDGESACDADGFGGVAVLGWGHSRLALLRRVVKALHEFDEPRMFQITGVSATFANPLDDGTWWSHDDGLLPVTFVEVSYR